MPFSLRRPWLMVALCAAGLAAASHAQTPAAAVEPSVPAVLEPDAQPTAEPNAPVATQPKRSRVMSDEVAATLATGMPKYNPPPKPVEPTPEEELVDLRDTDKPRNKIIRLPKYVVKEPKPPVFRERDLRTKSGLADLGLKRHSGLKVGNLGGLNQPIALLMYQEQERLDNMADLKEEANNARRTGDDAAADYILRESTRTYYRPSDFGWNSDNPGK